MSDKVKYVLYKISVVILLVLVINLFFIFFYPTVFTSIYFSITLILFNLFIIVDKIFQPPIIYGKKERTKKDLLNTLYLVLFLFANPFLFTFPYLEYSLILKTILSPELTLVLWVLGNLLQIIGGITMCMGRYSLGKEANLLIGIEKDHKLVTNGPYHIIRHPIYAGTIFLCLGYALSFSSIISAFILLLVFIPWFIKRMTLEEKLLLQTFGDEYLEYMKHTKRLIPLLY